MYALLALLCLSSYETRDVVDEFETDEEIAKVSPLEDVDLPRPVDFMHIGRDGFGDVEFKQPLAFLELDMVKPRDAEHAKELLRKTKKTDIQWLPKDKLVVFNSPRDEFLYFRNLYENTKNTTTGKYVMMDFMKNLERNLAHPEFRSRKSDEPVKNENQFKNRKFEPKKNISEYFEENAFLLKTDRNKFNWTTCDEFSHRAVFHPNDIVDTRWIPFYIWSKRQLSSVAFIHTFAFPTNKRINYYKTAYGPYIKDIDWSQPKLLLKQNRESLLIAADNKGLFYEIPDQEPPKPEEGKVTLPKMELRIKIINPYIAMMYCDEHYAAIMAELDTEPIERDEKITEAAKLRFKGFGYPAFRDLKTENKLAKIKAFRIKEKEKSQNIKIKKLIGDVDDKVRH